MNDPRFEALKLVDGNTMINYDDADIAICTCARCGREVEEEQGLCDPCADLVITEDAL